MSAIDFYCSVDKIKGVDGNNRVVVTLDGKYLPHSEQVSVSFVIRIINIFTNVLNNMGIILLQRTDKMVSRLNLKGSTSE